MIRISLSYVFDLALKIEPLNSLPNDDTKLRDVFVPIVIAQGQIEALYGNTLYSPYLRASSPAAYELVSKLKEAFSKSDPDAILTRWDFAEIKRLYEMFKTTLMAELCVLNSYFVNQQGGFDTLSLLMFGENLFPNDLKDKVPEALLDAREGAKCIAYEVATAAGYHFFRAVESVLRRYYAHVTNGASPPKVRSISVYVRALSAHANSDEKVLACLKQLADLHRNPLIHPEVVLTLEDAISIHGMARSVIGAMLKHLPDIPKTTSIAA